VHIRAHAQKHYRRSREINSSHISVSEGGDEKYRCRLKNWSYINDKSTNEQSYNMTRTCFNRLHYRLHVDKLQRQCHL